MPVQVIQGSDARQHSVNRLDAICLGLLLVYFLHFALPALRGGFRDDEMMNLYFYWSAGPLKSMQANLCFWWTIPPRPAGALYYLPLYHFFFLDPLPYRIVQIAILAATIPIIFRLAQLLSGSRSVAFLVALGMCYHGEMANLVFTGAFIYDVLCAFFYFAALWYYVHIREQGVALRPVQLAIFLALYICALNSKEMAVSLPVIVLVYEALRWPRVGNVKEFARHDWYLAIPPFMATLVTAFYIHGKLNGPDSLANLAPYRPVYSWHRFTITNTHFINELLYQSALPGGRVVLLLWPIVFLLAFCRRDRLLELMAFWVVVTPLPLAFIPGRGGAMLYIVFFGWATIFARILTDAIGSVAKLPALAPPTAMLPGFVTAALALALAVFTDWQNQRSDRTRRLVNSGQKSLHVIQAFRSLHLQPAPGSSILLQPETRFYQNGYYPVFVASLVWNDHSLKIYAAGAHQFTEQEMGTMNYVISFNEFKAQLLVSRNPHRFCSHDDAAGTSPGKSPRRS